MAVPECSDVRALAEIDKGGALVAASAGEPVFADAEISGENEISAEMEVPGGRYSAWLSGSIGSDATLSVDGEEVATRGALLNNEGLYAELGEVDLDAGTHTVTVEFAGAGLAPGSGGASRSRRPDRARAGQRTGRAHHR